MLQRIGRVPSDLKICITALTWLLYSLRSLTLRELAVASVIDPTTAFNEETLLDSEDFVLEICGSFIKMDPDTMNVVLAHFSVREYLTSSKLQDGSANEYYISQERGDALLMRSCFTYLSTLPAMHHCESDHDWHKWNTDRFLTYAAYSWPHHAEIISTDTAYANDIVSFLMSNSYVSWSQIWREAEFSHRVLPELSFGWFDEENSLDISCNWEGEIRKIRPPSPLYVAVTLGFHTVAKILLDLGADPNQRGGVLLFALFTSLMCVNTDMLRLLLKAGADTQVTRQGGWTALHIAAYYRHHDAVALLYESKADIHARLRSGETPLALVLSEQTMDIENDFGERDDCDELACDLFTWLEETSETSVPSCLSTPLHFAVTYGDLELTRALLQNRAKEYLNVPDPAGDTPLHMASKGSGFDIIELLLNVGADVNVHDELGRTSLQVAAWNRNLEAMELLGRVSIDDLHNIPLTNWIPVTSHPMDRTPIPFEEHFRMVHHFVKLNPTDHVWQTILADYHFQCGNHEIAFDLYGRALQVNSKNRNAGSIDEIVHSLRCEVCGDKILGQFRKCRLCMAYNCRTCTEDFISCRDDHPHDYSDLFPSSSWFENLSFNAHTDSHANRDVDWKEARNDTIANDIRTDPTANRSELEVAALRMAVDTDNGNMAHFQQTARQKRELDMEQMQDSQARKKAAVGLT